MKTLYLERSGSNCRKGDWTGTLDLDGTERIVVGMGPGSFAGVRAALAFARGYALGRPATEVLGLPSPCAIAGAYRASASGAESPLAVIGDARRGRKWIALFDGCKAVKPIFQIEGDAYPAELLHSGTPVLSPDDSRIGEELRAVFADRYLGEALPTDEGLRLYAEANPGELTVEPLPIYLNPAVRN